MIHRQKTLPPSSAQLFGETPAAPPAGVHTANIDGASRGNPGPAAYAVILRGPGGTKIAEISKCIGRKTNNVAEYYALVAALDYAVANSIRALRVRSDSELLVRQMQGRYKVKNAELKPLHERARKLARGLDYFAIEHVPRERNSEADLLANLALDGSSGSKAGPALERNATPSGERPATRLRIRARYRGGVFVPSGAVEIPENAGVELEVTISRNEQSSE
jgi:ribonuclease HI